MTTHSCYLKDFVFGLMTLLYIFFAKKGDTSMDILVCVWIRFYDNSNEDDVLALEEYLNKTVQLFDKKCCCYISCGKKLIVNRTWSNGKPDLIYTFKISETPIRHDIIDIIKKILIKAKDKFDFFFSDNKNCIFEKVQNKKYKTIPTYLEQCKENPNNPFI